MLSEKNFSSFIFGVFEGHVITEDIEKQNHYLSPGEQVVFVLGGKFM